MPRILLTFGPNSAHSLAGLTPTAFEALNSDVDLEPGSHKSAPEVTRQFSLKE